MASLTMLHTGIMMVLTGRCRRQLPLSLTRYDDEVIVETRVTALRNHLLKFGYRLLRESAVGEPAPGEIPSPIFWLNPVGKLS